MPLTDEMDAIRELLSCVHADGKHVTDAYIEEKDGLAKLKKLHLSALDADMLLLAVDEGRKVKDRSGKVVKICLSPLFADSEHGQNRACDAVLIRKTEQGICLYYIDLKSDCPRGFEDQFKSTQAVMRYIFNVVEVFFGIKVSIAKERFIVFHTDTKNAGHLSIKKKTRFTPKDANSPASPEKICVRNGDTHRCTSLL